MQVWDLIHWFFFFFELKVPPLHHRSEGPSRWNHSFKEKIRPVRILYLEQQERSKPFEGEECLILEVPGSPQGHLYPQKGGSESPKAGSLERDQQRDAINTKLFPSWNFSAALAQENKATSDALNSVEDPILLQKILSFANKLPRQLVSPAGSQIIIKKVTMSPEPLGHWIERNFGLKPKINSR